MFVPSLEQDKEFISQLLDPSKIETFTLPFKTEATLRVYQQKGLDWLAFLNRYYLNGILSDGKYDFAFMDFFQSK